MGIKEIESSAIMLGLDKLLRAGIRSDILVHCDNIGSINDLINPFKKGKISIKSAEIAEKLEKRGCRLFVHKVKAHRGDIGNARADELAAGRA